MIGMDPKKPIVTPIFIPYSTQEKCVNVIVGIVHTPSKYGNLHLNGGLKYRMKYTILKIINIKFLFIFLICYCFFSTIIYAKDVTTNMSNGKFYNPPGSPKRDGKGKFSYWTFLKEKKKIKINIPSDHVIDESTNLKNLDENKNNDYVMWIGHATFLIKLGDNIIITDPVFSKNAGPLFLGSYRYVDPAISLDNIPKVNLLLQTHNHYDHLDIRTLKKFPYKDTNVILPLKMKKYFSSNGFKNVKELNWYQQINLSNDLKVTLVPSIHWSKRTPFDTNETLWGSFIIEYKNKKILFACDTGSGNIYKDIGQKFGPIDMIFINIGAYDFRPMFEKSIYHTTPEEAVEIGKMVKAKKIIGMHWGTFILSLEDPFEPPKRFKNSARKFGYNQNDLILFKIGEIKTINQILE